MTKSINEPMSNQDTNKREEVNIVCQCAKIIMGKSAVRQEKAIDVVYDMVDAGLIKLSNVGEVVSMAYSDKNILNLADIINGLWISVEDRLPEEGKYVLASCDNLTDEDSTVLVAILNDDAGEWYSGFPYDQPVQPTHWMKFPQPYSNIDRCIDVQYSMRECIDGRVSGGLNNDDDE